jgi:hypothetical protein
VNSNPSPFTNPSPHPSSHDLHHNQKQLIFILINLLLKVNGEGLNEPARTPQTQALSSFAVSHAVTLTKGLTWNVRAAQDQAVLVARIASG